MMRDNAVIFQRMLIHQRSHALFQTMDLSGDPSSTFSHGLYLPKYWEGKSRR